jgi:hypothetical protein
MQPDAQQAARTALKLGPGHCPPDLFRGSVASIVRGLKAHANTIAHTRHIALEETFPRTRALLGVEAFHASAEAHLADPRVLRLPLAHIGNGFARRLADGARDLAAVEFAWLEAHSKADAPSFDLTAIAGLDANAVASATVSLHPASRLLVLIDPWEFVWEGQGVRGNAILLTRPHADVIVTGVDDAASSMFRLLDRPRLLGDLLELDPAAVTTLVDSGALTLFPEIML